MNTPKLSIIDYVLLGTLVVLVVGYSFGGIPTDRVVDVREWITHLLIAFGFKKLPQSL